MRAVNVPPNAFSYADFVGGASVAVGRATDRQLVERSFPVYRAFLSVENLDEVRNRLECSWKVRVPVETLAHKARGVYESRRDLRLLEKRSVTRGSCDDRWDLLDELNRDLMRKMERERELYANSEMFVRLAKVALGESNLGSFVNPLQEYTVESLRNNKNNPIVIDNIMDP